MRLTTYDFRPRGSFFDTISQKNNMSNQNNNEEQAPEQKSNTVKDPDQWTTGAEPMTGAQKSYLKTLSDEAGEETDENLTKAEASKKIDELQHKTGRGLNNGQ
ncbi:hypothetical protein SAE01_37940 [Segetibacter aerophilus]|uniref:DUF3072 domain-containing protein n=2 Tax=Segetibacter aerophilus TaxID=670293 RepID=A0A512BH48_9BACT|nr:hypothetical protein SAE01_37940 [Segetibacter aerophilus]